MLWNIDLLRQVFSETVFEIRAGPFVDIGRVAGEHQTFFDTGVRVEAAFMNSLRLNFSFGADFAGDQTAAYYQNGWSPHRRAGFR